MPGPHGAAAPVVRVVAALGVAQTIAWASSFYLPTLLAAPMARELGIAPSGVFAALSLALLLGAALSPWAGRQVDARGGRPLLLLSLACFVAGLATLALARGVPGLVLAWVLIGAGMGTGLYDTAFATLVRLYGTGARRPISGVTLVAGFASTVGWPLTAWMEAHWGWRGACWGWVLLHGAVALPLVLSLPGGRGRAGARPDTGPASGSPAADTAEVHAPPVPPVPSAPPTAAAAAPSPAPPPARVLLVALLFACLSIVGTAIASHLPGLLLAAGVPLAAAVGLAALAGPSQVAARLVELGWLSRRPPMASAALAVAGHPLAAALLLALGPVAALPFVLLHGAGNGLVTIVRGTLPLALFGAAGYGARQGLILLPGRVLGAASPFVLGWLIERHGSGALGFTLALGLAAMGLLALLAAQARPRPAGGAAGGRDNPG